MVYYWLKLTVLNRNKDLSINKWIKNTFTHDTLCNYIKPDSKNRVCKHGVNLYFKLDKWVHISQDCKQMPVSHAQKWEHQDVGKVCQQHFDIDYC